MDPGSRPERPAERAGRRVRRDDGVVGDAAVGVPRIPREGAAFNMAGLPHNTVIPRDAVSSKANTLKVGPYSLFAATNPYGPTFKVFA